MPKKGYKQTEEHKKKSGLALVGRTGHKLSEEHKKNLSLSHKGQERSKKTISKWKESIKNYKQTNKTKEKRRISFMNWMKKGESTNSSDYIKFIERITNLGKSSKGRKLSLEHKHKVRIASLNYLRDVRDIKWPCVGKYEKSIIKSLEKCFNYIILRQYRVEGYFLDGYCPALNLAIEIDENHHKRKEKEDAFRQNKIQEKLKCSFLRIPINKEIGGLYASMAR